MSNLGDIALIAIGGYAAYQLTQKQAGGLPAQTSGYANTLLDRQVSQIDRIVTNSRYHYSNGGGNSGDAGNSDLPAYRDNNGVVMTFNDWVNNKGTVPALAIKTGTALSAGIGHYTGGIDPVKRAAQQGVQFRADLKASGQNKRYDDLGKVTKAAVTTGEAITRTFGGFSAVKAGQTTRNTINSYGDKIKSKLRIF